MARGSVKNHRKSVGADAMIKIDIYRRYVISKRAQNKSWEGEDGIKKMENDLGQFMEGFGLIVLGLLFLMMVWPEK